MNKFIKVQILAMSIISIMATFCSSQRQDTFSLDDAVIVADGNSLTYGVYLTDSSYTEQLKDLDPFVNNGANIYNFGVSGQTTPQMQADAATQIDPLQNSSVANILVAWEITNDLYYNGNVASAQTNFQNYCQSRKAAGWDKIIVMSVIPRNQTPEYAGGSAADYTNKINQANTWLRANWQNFADGFIDLPADSRLSSITSTYYLEDQIHLNAAGYGVVAELVRNKLLSLTP